MQDDQPLWAPDADEIDRAVMTDFARFGSERSGVTMSDFKSLHQWSVSDREGFWSAVWDYCGVVGNKGETVLENGDAMPGARFFPQASLNFAENLLKTVGDHDAIIFRGEDKAEARMSWNALHALVSRLQQAMLDLGIGPGDRVAAMMPNVAETIAAMLAAASIGAIWSSCSPDFGDKGVLDRFGQIEPKLFIACDGYWYNGKRQDVADKLVAVEAALNPLKTVIVPYAGDTPALVSRLENAVSLADFTASFEPRPVTYTRLPFDHPLYILFSSGTTGVPKCIVHSAGGTLLQHLKEQQIHSGLRPGERLFYFTTCGWMMWNWLASGLASGVTLCLFDGSPFYPDEKVLFDYAQAEGFAIFGTSAKYIDAVRKSGFVPRVTHDLSTVRMMTSTGSPLSPEGFNFVYEGIKPDIHLASISGGTDIVSCFVFGVPILPVWRGEIQGAGLGMDVDVWNDDGQPVRQEKGELVCTRAFPCMPVGFWNDPDGAKYKAAYFERFDNIWCHGDFAEWTEHDGIIIHGRSDATLNPGGVRIGTAEIYNQVEQMDEVLEAICIGQDWQDDVRVVLFVRLADGVALDEDLTKRIKMRIRTGASPRHVPAVIIAVDDIPRTKSGKITELAVRDVVHGRQVKNQEALANPEALKLFADLEGLK
ncbi:MAG: acetoacetate--CoA ligase [Alphaproteobacteria bacterium]|nr:acetoacetate--CoA ligase [Alphaproteobacteria bacterium]